MGNRDFFKMRDLRPIVQEKRCFTPNPLWFSLSLVYWIKDQKGISRLFSSDTKCEVWLSVHYVCQLMIFPFQNSFQCLLKVQVQVLCTAVDVNVEERKTKPKHKVEVEELVRLRANLLLQLAAGGPQTSFSSHSNTQRPRVKEISNKPPDHRQPDHHHVSIIRLWTHWKNKATVTRDWNAH